MYKLSGASMLSREARILKRYRRFKIISLVVILLLLSLLSFVVYTNVDYIIFKYLIADNYIYSQTLDELYVQIGQTGVKDYKKHFDNFVIAAVTEKLRSANNDRYTYLYTPSQYKLEGEATKAVALEAVIEQKTDETVYLRVPNVSKYTRDFITGSKEQLNAYKNIIIDLRTNYGGNLGDLYGISELFLDKGMTIGYEKTRSAFFSKQVKAKKPRYFDFEKIILLQDENTASAAEGFIVSLSENLNNVKIVGTQSFGKGIGQITIPLRRGYAVKATVLQIETPKGGSINKVGITPDIIYKNADIVEYCVNELLTDWRTNQ